MITNKQIEKWNDDFKKLSKPEKRVAIAKDVIAQIKAQRYAALVGRGYINVNCDNDLYDTSIQKNFNKVDCEVCAVGALFMSTVKFTNKCSFSEADLIHSGSLVFRLRPYFSKYQLILIESAFEKFEGSEDLGNYRYNSTYHAGVACGEPIKSKNDLQKAYRFCDEEEEGDERLIKICKNIIKNNGTFKP